jgi:hypothetical protein
MNSKSGLILGRRCKWLVSAVGLVFLQAGLWGCGIKAPPVPPDRLKPPAIVDLNYRRDGVTLTLSWRLAADPEAATAVADICRVYRAKTSLSDTSCPDCPLPFEMVAEVPTGGDPAAGDATLGWTENLERGFGYTYKVISVTADGITGDPSDTVYATY